MSKNVNVKLSDASYQALRGYAIRSGLTNARVIELALAQLETITEEKGTSPEALAAEVETPRTSSDIIASRAAENQAVLQQELDRVPDELAVGRTHEVPMPIVDEVIDVPQELPVGSEGASTREGEGVGENALCPSDPADHLDNEIESAIPTGTGVSANTEDDWLEEMMRSV